MIHLRDVGEIFHPLEVVGRDNETQLQVGEKLNPCPPHFFMLS